MPSKQKVEYAIQMLDALSPETHRELIRYVEGQESHFTSTTTTTGAAHYRASKVLFSFPLYEEILREKVRSFLPHACSLLGITRINGNIEAQLTMHGDRHYYKVHNDNGHELTQNRVLTYVYYFHREPKAFKDGQLRIYQDSDLSTGFIDIEPVNNSLVFFNSRQMHEVLPVSCPSKQFMDSRFTINGWVSS